MSRPSDHVDAGRDGFEPRDHEPTRPAGGGASSRVAAIGRTIWRQFTSMRVALLLLLLLAIAAVPGSLVPQRSSDPNGVTQYFDTNPQLAPALDAIGMFGVYTSPWFTAIYLLLFVSLVGCIIPRVLHHWKALRSPPPTTPARLGRLDAYAVAHLDASFASQRGKLIESARQVLRRRGYRVVVIDQGVRGLSVSAERGYLRETGNLVFHVAMLGVILSVGVLGGFSWHGQRVLVEGQTFVNSTVNFSSFSPGRFFSDDQLDPYAMRLDRFEVDYVSNNPNAAGAPSDFRAGVTVTTPGEGTHEATVRVNDPLRTHGTDVYLLGNGYAPQITVRDPAGNAVFSDHVPFLPQDANLTSLGVVKVPDGLAEQLGMIGFFYPSAATLSTGALTSNHPDLRNPELTLNVFAGDLGLDRGTPVNVYSLDTDGLTQLAGGKTGVEAIKLTPGERVELPNGLGSIELGDVPRYASFDIHHDPTQVPVLVSVAFVIGGLIVSLLVPRRRLWVKATERSDGSLVVEYAGLARGEDPRLAAAVNELVDAHDESFVGFQTPSEPPKASS